jgi:ribosomal protein L37AE/L43A
MGWPEDYDDAGCFEPFDGICPGCGEEMEEVQSGRWLCDYCGDIAVNDALKPEDYDAPVQVDVEATLEIDEDVEL